MSNYNELLPGNGYINQNNIEQNTNNIKQNTNNIELNTNNIKQNTNNIELNTNNIELNTNNIELNTNNIELNTNNIEVINKKIFTQTKYLPIDGVISSLNSLKDAMYNVNLVNSLIDKHLEDIISKQNFKNPLQPDVEASFTTLDSTLEDFFFIQDIPKDLNQSTLDKCKEYYTYKKYDELLSETCLNEIDDEELHKLLENELKEYYNKRMEIGKYYLEILEWKDGMKLRVQYCRSLPWDTTCKIIVASGVYLSDYIDIGKFVIPDDYKIFINSISNLLSDTDVLTNISSRISNAIWEYGTSNKFNNLKCIKSDTYPYWINQYIIQCYIEGSDDNIPEIMKSIILNLENRNPYVKEGFKAFVTYNIEDIDYCGIVTFIKINNVMCFNIKEIVVNPFFDNAQEIIGDTRLIGGLNVKTHDGKNIIQTNNVTKTITFNDKVGINQQPHEVKALLDIDNLAIANIYDVVQTIPLLMQNGANISEILKTVYIDTEDFSNIFLTSTLSDYKNECAIMKIPIKASIEENDINFLYTSPTGEFGSEKLDNRSVNIIQILANNIFKMSLLEDELTTDNTDHIYTFIELLNDTNNNYVSVLKGFYVNDCMLFTLTYTNANNYMNDLSYRDTFIKFINELSSTTKMVEIAHIIIQDVNVFNEVINNKNSVDSFTKVLNNSFFKNRFDVPGSYIYSHSFAEYGTPERENTVMIMHEVFTEWNGELNNQIYQPKTKQPVIRVIKELTQVFHDKYNSMPGQSCLVDYEWIDGYKVACLLRNTKDGIDYTIGNGINVKNYIDQSIITKGDTSIQGNFVVENTSGQQIYKVDTLHKGIINNYNVGIGTNFPKSSLDVKSSGMDDIIDVITKSGINYLNNQLLLKKLKLASSDTEFPDIIEKHFQDIDVLQTKDNYVTICKYNTDTMLARDTKVIYHFLFNHLNGKYFIDNEDNNIQNVINRILNVIQEFLDKKLIIVESVITWVFNFIYGAKRMMHKYFKFNDELYCLVNGINIQDFDLDPTDNNIIQYYTESEYMNIILNDIYLELESLTDCIYNLQQHKDSIQILKNTYSKLFTNIYSIKINHNNLVLSEIADFKYDSMEICDYVVINEITDPNEKSKKLNTIISIAKTYGTNYKDTLGYNGVVHYDDLTNDFKAKFTVLNNNEIILIESKISDIITPTVDVNGDTKLKGDLILNNKYNDTNYLSVDPKNEYVGINTDERYSSYDSAYQTSSSLFNSKHHVYVKHDLFPNAVFERIGENLSKPDDLLFTNTASVTAINCRRKSTYLNFNEMYNYAEFHHQNIIKEDNYDNVTSIKYGINIAFELTDKTNITKEIGSLSMEIDSIDEEGNTKTGFSVISYDQVKNKDDPNRKDLIAKNLMYVNNDSTMYIKKIMLNGKMIEYNKETDTLLFDNQKVVLSFQLIIESLSDVNDIIIDNITPDHSVRTIRKLIEKQNNEIKYDDEKYVLQLTDGTILDTNDQLVVYDIDKNNNTIYIKNNNQGIQGIQGIQGLKGDTGLLV